MEYDLKNKEELYALQVSYGNDIEQFLECLTLARREVSAAKDPLDFVKLDMCIYTLGKKIVDSYLKRIEQQEVVSSEDMDRFLEIMENMEY